MTSLYKISIGFALFLSSFFLFTWGLQSQEIIGFDSRFFLFAQEMLANGLTWFPTTYHQPYPDYTSAGTLLISFVAKLTGNLNKFSAVFPSAFAASACVVTTYMLGSLFDKRWGLYAAIFLIFTLVFFKSSRAISLDLYPAAITAMCFYLVAATSLTQQSTNTFLLLTLLFLGFIFRGPIGLVIPTGVICTYYLLTKNYKKFFTIGFSATILLIAGLGLLLSLAWYVGGATFMHDVLRMQITGRMENHTVAHLFYFIDSLKNYAPTFPLVIVILPVLTYYYFANKRQLTLKQKFLWQLFAWVFVILIGMSIPDDKKARYVLAMAPALALIASYPFIAPENEKYFIVLRKIILFSFLFLPVIFLSTLIALYFYINSHNIQLVLAYYLIVTLLILLQTINVISFFKQNKSDLLIVIAAALSFVTVYISLVEPLEIYFNRGQNFVTQIEQTRKKEKAQLVFYKESADGLPIKYLIHMPQREVPKFLTDEDALAKYSMPAYFLTSENYFQQISETMKSKLHIIAKDSLGHVPVVVFAKS